MQLIERFSWKYQDYSDGLLKYLAEIDYKEGFADLYVENIGFMYPEFDKEEKDQNLFNFQDFIYF